jgi:hypothetical protein
MRKLRENHEENLGHVAASSARRGDHKAEKLRFLAARAAPGYTNAEY